jgi:deoxyribonuclease V
MPPIPTLIHRWDLTPGEAMTLQKELATRVERSDRFDTIRLIAGIDISANDHTGIARAAIVVLSYPDMAVIEQRRHEEPLRFPYVPGLLSFRETPSILATYEQLLHRPDLLMVDGQGIAHPRRLGIASHLGLLLDTPSIGVAKSILVGKHQPVGERVGDWQPLIDRGEVIGAALRTREKVTPIYVSIGHRVSLETAIAIVLRCCRGYRLPEPTRHAHNVAGLKEPISPSPPSAQESQNTQLSLW